jgi:hypothetical protein
MPGDNQIDALGPQHFQSFGAIRDFLQPAVLAFEQPGKRLTHGRVFLDHEKAVEVHNPTL